MIKRFLAWLRKIYFTDPAPLSLPTTAESTQTATATAVAETQKPEGNPVSVLQLTILSNNQSANGTSLNSVQAYVTDNGAAAAGAPVFFSVSGGTVSPASGVTDANGQLIASVSNTAGGPITMTAKLADGTSQTVTLTFVAVVATTSTDTTSTTTAAAATTETISTTTLSLLDKEKAKFDNFVKFVEFGIKVFGADAEADLVALKEKYL